MVKDAVGRRSPHERQSTGKRVQLTDRDILWLQKLAEHGPLPTSYLLAYSRALRHSQKRDQERLGDLFHEANTEHSGAYLDRPPQQFATLKAGYNQLVHALSKTGGKALQKTTRGASAKPLSGPWLHRHMVACVTASVELATLTRSDVSYISERAILDRAQADLRCPIDTPDPETGRLYTKDLIPDAIFGLQYHLPDASKFRFFVVEADRSTEPATSKNWNRKSFERHLVQYEAYIEQKAYQEHLGLSSPLLVLNVCSDEARVKLMARQTENQTGPCTYQLFQTFPEFAPPWKPPEPRRELLEFPWRRVGMEDFRIDVLYHGVGS